MKNKVKALIVCAITLTANPAFSATECQVYTFSNTPWYNFVIGADWAVWEDLLGELETINFQCNEFYVRDGSTCFSPDGALGPVIITFIDDSKHPTIVYTDLPTRPGAARAISKVFDNLKCNSLGG